MKIWKYYKSNEYYMIVEKHELVQTLSGWNKWRKDLRPYKFELLEKQQLKIIENNTYLLSKEGLNFLKQKQKENKRLKLQFMTGAEWISKASIAVQEYIQQRQKRKEAPKIQRDTQRVEQWNQIDQDLRTKFIHLTEIKFSFYYCLMTNIFATRKPLGKFLGERENIFPEGTMDSKVLYLFEKGAIIKILPYTFRIYSDEIPEELLQFQEGIVILNSTIPQLKSLIENNKLIIPKKNSVHISTLPKEIRDLIQPQIS